MTAILRQGDAWRDRGDPAAAAASYAAALDAAPSRTDIRVQLANMQKDSGQFSLAETNYRRAIMEVPDDPDIHLQLGHLCKLQGRRGNAVAAYRRAADLDPHHPAARHELAQAGVPAAQTLAFEDQIQAGGVQAVLAMSHAIVQLQARLDDIRDALPHALAAAAFPVEQYAVFRSLYDIPPPPPAAAGSTAILLLAGRADRATLRGQLDAIAAQSLPDWTLIVIGGGLPCGRLARDPRVCWADPAPGESPQAAELRLAASQRSRWTLLLADGAILHRHALAWFAASAAIAPAAAFICDEDTVHSDGSHTGPALRHLVDYDTLLDANVFGETVFLETAGLAALPAGLAFGSHTQARSTLLLSLAGSGPVGHVPFPLVSRRDPHPEPDTAGHRAAVTRHLAARPANPDLPADTPITVVIPTRDNIADLRAMVESLAGTAAQPDALRILVVDNGSRGAGARHGLAALAAQDAIRLLTLDEPFNWSRLNNHAAGLDDAPLLVFANDDMRMLSPGWDAVLRRLLARPKAGAVGARLLYEDGTIQHAGILLGWRGSPTIHDGLHAPGHASGPGLRWQVTRAAAAVTGAFLATRRDSFADVGGFDADCLPVGYGDVDYALKLRAAGLTVLWTPDISLTHRESKTRGLDRLDPDRLARNDAAERVMHRRWGAAFLSDPGVHPAWHPATLPFRLLSQPSEAAAIRHIRACAAPEPWRVAPA